MTRVHSSSSRGTVVGAIVTCVLMGFAAPKAAGQAPAKQPEREITFSVAKLTTQLGLKVQPRESDDIALGASFTALLTDPDKLARVGIRGLHEGARVTVSRVGPDRIRVDADELEPVPVRGLATLRADEKGELTPVPPKNP